MEYHPKHLCRNCGKPLEMHAGRHNPDCPPFRCPGKKEPHGKILDNSLKADRAFRLFWNQRKTQFEPVR